MGRRVRLWDKENEYGNSDSSYKAGNGKYYSSKEAYQNIQINSNNRKKCIDKMHELLGYEEYQIVPTIFLKKLKEWKPYGYDVVLQTISDTWYELGLASKNKNFDNEVLKVQYLSAIISNRLNDAKKKLDKEKKNIRCNTLIIDEFVGLDISNNSQKKKDISKFLEDED